MNPEQTKFWLQEFTRGQDPNELLVLATNRRGGRTYKRIPSHDHTAALAWIAEMADAGADVWYKTCLFKPDAIRLVKDTAQEQMVWLWADLDEMHPGSLPLRPTMLVRSSPGRYQALWRLAAPRSKWECEALSRELAAYGDRSGWDIGQELRVPGTLNHKYNPAPTVEIVETYNQPHNPASPTNITPARTTSDVPYDMPEPEPQTGPDYLYGEPPPRGNRSAILWAIAQRLRDDGVELNMAFAMLWHSPYNKFRADNRPPAHLWGYLRDCWDRVRYPRDVIVLANGKVSEGKEVMLEPYTVIGNAAVGVRAPQTVTEHFPTITAWPLMVGRAIEALRPSVLFSDEAIALAFLSAYSACWPDLRIQGSNVGVWTMVIGGQASGKSTLLQAFSSAALDCAPSLQLVTSGSPEGIMETVSKGPALLVFEEYSEQLKQMARSDGYAAINKEVFSKLFDGARIGHATRRASLSSGRTFTVMMAATNADTWRKYGDPEDVSNGYLSRFMVIAPDLVERSINRSLLWESVETLSGLMLDRIQRGWGLRHAVLSNIMPDADMTIRSVVPGAPLSFGDLRLQEYQYELEKDWDLHSNLDEAAQETVYMVPPGRVLTKVRKLAVMLELSEFEPMMVNDHLFVREENVVRAIQLSRLGSEWASRAINWLQNSQEKQYVDRILHQLERSYPEYLRPWDIAVNIRGLKSADVRRLLGIMADSGMVEKKLQPRANGQPSELWRTVK